MDLYTSLVRLKQSLNGGQLPPMTPVPENVLHFIDPAFTPGLGALHEDAVLGLRCPVRGCGRYMHSLRTHVNRSHKDIGGEGAIRRALSIPATARLCSQVLSAKRTRITHARTDAWRSGLDARNRNVGKRGKAIAANTVGARNLRNTCEVQLKHSLIDIKNRLGRSPIQREVIDMLPNGSSVIADIRRAYGTFNNFKSLIGLDTYGATGSSTERHRRSPRVTRDMVLDALAEWYTAHHALPTCTTVEEGVRVPALPNKKTIFKAMGTTSWPEAMRRVAAILDIYGGRYGLPKMPPPQRGAA